MQQFLLVAGFQIVMFILFLLIHVQKPEPIEEVEEPQTVEVVILSKSSSIIGTFNNKTIHEFILLDSFDVYEYSQIFDGVFVQEDIKYLIFNGLKYIFHSKLDNIEQFNDIINK